MTNPLPLLSIIIPTYNRGDTFLRQAISTILSQSFSNFELLVIDDASTDTTQEVLRTFDDPRIISVKMDVNHGEYWATNFGIGMAKGKFLTWVHSDDVLPSDSLKQRIDVLTAHPNLNFVHGNIEKIDEQGMPIEILPAVDWPKEKLLTEYLKLPKEREQRYMIHHLTIMMKWKFFYEAGPFDCSLPFAGDIDWLIRAIRMGNFQLIPSVLYHYRSHSQTRRMLDVEKGVNKNDVHLSIARRYTTL